MARIRKYLQPGIPETSIQVHKGFDGNLAVRLPGRSLIKDFAVELAVLSFRVSHLALSVRIGACQAMPSSSAAFR